MEEGQFFQKALAEFTTEFAVGNEIRALADKGLSVEEIHDRLSFPVSRERIGGIVWEYDLKKGIILLEDPTTQSEREQITYEKVQNAYGKVSFRQMRRSVQADGEYLACDFGKMAYQDRKEYLDRLSRLNPKDRAYIEGLPWPLQTVYHRKDDRMKRIYSIFYK